VLVDGVTLSVEQFEYSRARALDLGYDGKIQFLLRDYRDLNQVYDRIVSVGMFEHVGRGFYNEFFQKCHKLLVSSEMAFREEGMMVFQIQMAKAQGVVPNIRDYIAENETYLRSNEVSERIDVLMA